MCKMYAHKKEIFQNCANVKQNYGTMELWKRVISFAKLSKKGVNLWNLFINGTNLCQIE